MSSLMGPHEALKRLCGFVGIEKGVAVRRIRVEADIERLATVEVEYLPGPGQLNGEECSFRLEPIPPGRPRDMHVEALPMSMLSLRLEQILREKVLYSEMRESLEVLLGDVKGGVYGPAAESVGAMQHAEDLRAFFDR